MVWPFTHVISHAQYAWSKKKHGCKLLIDWLVFLSIFEYGLHHSCMLCIPANDIIFVIALNSVSIDFGSKI